MRALVLAEVGGVSGGFWADDGYGNETWYADNDKRAWSPTGGSGTGSSGSTSSASGMQPYTYVTIWGGGVVE